MGCSLLGAAAVVLKGSTEGLTQSQVLTAAAMGAGCVLASGLGAVFTLRALVRNPDLNLGTVSLGFSFVRLFGSLALGLVVLLGLNPAKTPFVYAFLFAAMSALFLETLILRRWAALTPDPTGAPGGGPSK